MERLKLNRVMLIIFALLFLSLPGYGNSMTLVAAADPWPPFVDPENPKEGLSLEIIRAAYETQGYEIEMKYVPWARAIEGVINNRYDILPPTWKTEEREKNLKFSDPYLINEIKFIKQKGDSFEYNGIGSLENKKIGVIRGYGYGNEFMTADNFQREEVSKFIFNIRKLVAGRLDLTLEDEIVARIKMAKEDEDLLNQVEFVENPLSKEDLYIAVGYKNPRHEEIINAFNKGLKIIKENGKYNEIMEKYGIDIKNKKK